MPMYGFAPGMESVKTEADNREMEHAVDAARLEALVIVASEDIILK